MLSWDEKICIFFENVCDCKTWCVLRNLWMRFHRNWRQKGDDRHHKLKSEIQIHIATDNDTRITKFCVKEVVQNEMMYSRFYYLIIFNFLFFEDSEDTNQIHCAQSRKYMASELGTKMVSPSPFLWFVIKFSLFFISLQGHCRCTIRVVNWTEVSSKPPGADQSVVRAGVLALPLGTASRFYERKVSLQMKQKHFKRIRSYSKLSGLVLSKLIRLWNALSYIFCCFSNCQLMIDLQ